MRKWSGYHFSQHRFTLETKCRAYRLELQKARREGVRDGAQLVIVKVRRVYRFRRLRILGDVKQCCIASSQNQYVVQNTDE